MRSDIHKIFKLVTKSLQQWLDTKKLQCAFNPNRALWSLNKGRNKHFLDAGDKRFDLQYLIDNDIAMYFWMSDTFYDLDDSFAWLTIKQEIVNQIAPLGIASKKFQWGIITFKPEKLRNSKNQVEEWFVERKRVEEELARRKDESENKVELDSSYENDEDIDESDDDNDD